MQIAGTVIVYKPDEDAVIRNICSYINFLETLLVFDNSSCNKEFTERVRSISNKIVFISNTENEGIAKPLNRALTLIGKKYNWLLTMDQDSYFDAEQGNLYFGCFEKIFYNSSNIAIVCPNHSRQPATMTPGCTRYKEIIRAITSGSLINTKICMELKGFDERLFIDDVDLEYCYRCSVAGYKVIEFSSIYLNHELGTKKVAGYFSFLNRSTRSIHSPIRIYFMVRNFLYVSFKYKSLLPAEIKDRRKGLLVILKNNLFFSGQFLKVLVAAIKGYLHFKMKKFS